MTRTLTGLLLALLIPCCAEAQQAAPTPRLGARRTLTVGLAEFPPLVTTDDDGELTGFDVDLWRAIAAEQELEYKFEKVGSLRELQDALAAGRIDAALAGITITAERERRFDFSHQYLESGLMILVQAGSGNVLGTVLKNMFRGDILPWFAGGLVFILLTAAICWWSEQGEANFADSFVPGYFEAVYWTVVTMSTVGYGDFAPKRWPGRIVAIGVIFVGISLYGTLIAKGASALTVSQLEHDIASPGDLSGLRVGTLASSTSVEALQRLGARPVQVDRLEDAYGKLTAGEVRAVVYDAPTLMHYARGAGAGAVELLGHRFDEQYYGIAFPAGSPLREGVNQSLLELRVNGVYDRLFTRYFGHQGD